MRLLLQKRAERKKELIHEIGKQKYQLDIQKNTQDSNRDGISDELAIELGLDPNKKEPALPEEQLSEADMKLYNTTQELLDKKCTTNLYSGTRLSSKGFTVLAACPKNDQFTLSITDQDGREISLETRDSSNNHKIVFSIEHTFRTGTYVLQVRPKALPAEVASEPVLVYIVDDNDLNLTAPIVKKIENVEVAPHIRDIKISRTTDGRVHVTGIADAASVVMGTFSSAIFNSALLADTESGAFELVSPQPLGLGDHEIAIYATRPTDDSQSAPLRIRFSIVEGVHAAAGAEPTPSNSLFILFAALGFVVIFTATFIVIKKQRGKVAMGPPGAVVTQQTPLAGNQPVVLGEVAQTPTQNPIPSSANPAQNTTTTSDTTNPPGLNSS